MTDNLIRGDIMWDITTTIPMHVETPTDPTVHNIRPELTGVHLDNGILAPHLVQGNGDYK